MAKTALVVGGTGPTGPFIVEGLAERGYAVTILHRGFHEVEFKYPVKHIHGEPHFKEEFQQALGDLTFDVVVCMYGRLRLVAESCVGKTERFIAVGAGTPEDQHLPIYDVIQEREDGTILQRVTEAREQVFDYHRAGHYQATYIGYPIVYGPRQPGPLEWSIIRRILDGRRKFILLDNGLYIRNCPYVENCAQTVLLAIDKPEASAGKLFAATEEALPTDRYRLQLIADIMGVGDEIETYSFPLDLGLPGWWWGNGDFNFAKEGRPPHIVHRTVAVEKLKHELGYRDVVSVEEAHRRTVQWLLDHKPERGGEDERIMGDPFDYAAEDAYIEAYKRFTRELDTIPFSGYFSVHRYQHPKKPWEHGTSLVITERKTARKGKKS
ncbi:MAG: NAD-dependent epimerase/dehydratase family protein [Chloroflexi bacterium]|nr:NAD-dependent epimerase/dehydratase family protein [Chloroflexota bacterium]